MRALAERLVESAPTGVRRATAIGLREALANGALGDALRMSRTIGMVAECRAEKLVSHKFRYLWLCVPKAASRSIKYTLLDLDPDARVIEHKTLPEVYAMYPQARDYFSFAFVRDPCQRAFSCFAQKIFQSSASKRALFVQPYFGVSPDMSFGAFCRWLNTPWGSDAFADRHWLSQLPQLMLEDGKFPDFVGRVEHGEEDWRTVCERLDMPVRALKRYNVTVEQPLEEEALQRVEDLPRDELITQNESLLRERYAKDFAMIHQLAERRA